MKRKRPGLTVREIERKRYVEREEKRSKPMKSLIFFSNVTFKVQSNEWKTINIRIAFGQKPRCSTKKKKKKAEKNKQIKKHRTRCPTKNS